MSIIARSLAKRSANKYWTLTNLRSFSSAFSNNHKKVLEINNESSQTNRNILFSKNMIEKSLLKCMYSTDNELHKRIDQLVKTDKIVVFMKGTPEQPRCGFSKAVVDVLKMHGVGFDAYNILEDEELRSGIKEYSSWPTIPQVFFKGDFIGGCDILLEMHRSGELVEELEKVGIKSKLTGQEQK